MLRSKLSSFTSWAFIVASASGCSDRRVLGDLAESAVGGSANTGGASTATAGGGSTSATAGESATGGASMLATGGASATGGAMTSGGASGSPCQVTIAKGETSPTVQTYPYSYDVAIKRLIASNYAYDFDDQMRRDVTYDNNNGTLTFDSMQTFDSNGNITYSIDYTGHYRQYTNQYNGNLMIRVDEFIASFGDLHMDFSYGDTSSPDIWTSRSSGVGTGTNADAVWDRVIVDGLVTEATYSYPADPTQVIKYVFFYDSGRIVRLDRTQTYNNGSIRSTRYDWIRDSSGNVTNYTRDGVWGTLNDSDPNGVPDYSESYSTECASLLRQFPWLSHELIITGPEGQLGTEWF